MKYELLHNLGSDDARRCNDLGAKLSQKPSDLAAGCIVELSEKAFEYLTTTKGYTSLLKGVAKSAEIKGVKE